MRWNDLWSVALALSVGASVGCGRTPTAPTPGAFVSISCPVPQTATSADGNPVPVAFPAAVSSGGTGALSTVCTPSSGAAFPVGTSNVTCTAKDTKGQSASCGFQITVTKVPRLSATRFVAFGDSMTEGFEQRCPTTTLTGFAAFLDDARLLRSLRPPGFSAVSYPVQLQSMLAARYSAQTLSIINEGSGGEKAAEGVLDLPRVLSADTPQALLLLEGINDIHGGQPTQASAIPIMIGSLRTMVQDARRRGIAVFIATLLPQRRGACRDYDWDDNVEDVLPANAQIRSLAASEGATLIDMYPAFSGSVDTLLGPDGLHPNAAGYQKMAELFYGAITQRLEQ